MVDEARRQHARSLLVTQHDIRKQPLWRTRRLHRLLETLANKDRLCRVLQHHGIARDQRRHDRIDGRQVGIVPGSDDKHDTQRRALDHAPEARLWIRRQHRLQRILGNRHHVAHAFLEAPELAAETDRPPHLHRKFGNDLLVEREHRVEKLERKRTPVLQGYLGPGALRVARRLEGRLDLRVACHGPTGHFAPVNRGYADNVTHDGPQMISK